jgi:hypothetical protein
VAALEPLVDRLRLLAAGEPVGLMKHAAGSSLAATPAVTGCSRLRQDEGYARAGTKDGPCWSSPVRCGIGAPVGGSHRAVVPHWSRPHQIEDAREDPRIRIYPPRRPERVSRGHLQHFYGGHSPDWVGFVIVDASWKQPKTSRA